MNAADRPAPKDAPATMICVECGYLKGEHSAFRLFCPMLTGSPNLVRTPSELLVFR